MGVSLHVCASLESTSSRADILGVCRSSLDFSQRRVAYATAPLFRKLHSKKQKGAFLQSILVQAFSQLHTQLCQLARKLIALATESDLSKDHHAKTNILEMYLAYPSSRRGIRSRNLRLSGAIVSCNLRSAVYKIIHLQSDLLKPRYRALFPGLRFVAHCRHSRPGWPHKVCK